MADHTRLTTVMAVLHELNQVKNMQSESLPAAQKELSIDNAAGVRALLRLSTAAAVGATLRYALGRVGAAAPAEIFDESS